MRHLKNKLFIVISLSWVSSFLAAQDQTPEWTHFRGSKLDGISVEQDIPLSWNDSANISWKTAIDGRGWSSPVVYGNQVWITSATGGGNELRAVCLDFTSGEIIHNRILFTPDSLYRKHSINTYATPTAAIEEGYVYINFGRYGTACLDTRTGETIWERIDMQVEHIQGPGSSLLLYKDKLIVHMEGSDIYYILALDKLTGETLWLTHRPRDLWEQIDYIGRKAYITPIVVTVDGRNLIISNGSAACIAYDLDTGKEVWRIIQGEDSTIAMPSEGNGMVYFYTGFVTGSDGERYAELLAVDPDGEGDIGATHVRWRMKAPVLQLLSQLVAGNRLYTVDSKSLMICLDALTGETLWSKRLKGKYHSSPVYADGHVYISSTGGETIVIKEASSLEIISENSLDGEIWATPAITGGAILMRTSEFLYKIAL